MALRVLMVAPAMPAKSGNGLEMRLSIFLEALQSIAHTDLILIPILGDTTESNQGATEIARAPLQPDTELSLLLRLADREKRLQSFIRYGKSTFAGRFSPAAWKDLGCGLAGQSYDIVHISRSYLAPALPHIRGRSATTLDLDEDDLASFNSLASLERKRRNMLQAAWQEQEGKACDRLIGQAKGAVDLAFAASPKEVQNLSCRHVGLRIEHLPNAITIQRPHRQSCGNTLLFVGTLGYLPNNEGLLWFLEKVLPRIRSRRKCRVVIIGRGPPFASLKAAVRRAGVILRESVEDLESYYRSARAVIAPMRSGGGTRIKLLEAASFGVPSIATPAAASGLYSADRPWGWLADGPQQFADACLAALADAKQGAARAAVARNEVARNYDRVKIVRQLAQRFTALIDERETPGD